MLTVFLLIVLISTPAEPLTIFISAPMRDGFIDTSKDIEDSIKDIRSRLSRMKDFRVVDKRDEADIVLTIVARGIGSESYGQRLRYTEYYKNAELTNTPIIVSTLWVTGVIVVGDYRKEFIGTSVNDPGVRLGTWRECAKDLADNLKSWSNANTERLIQLRMNRPR